MKLPLITLLTVCTLSPLSVFAESSKFAGVIHQVECNSPSGLGVVQVEKRVGKTIEVHFLKVNSKALCGSGPRAFSRLGSIGYDAVLLGKFSLFELHLEDGFVTEMTEVSSVDYQKFTHKVHSYVELGAREAETWFFKGPAQLMFGMADLETRIQEYTAP